MPWKVPLGECYKLVFLDTNAISEISKNYNGVAESFIEMFPPDECAPCFSVYNLIELKKSDNDSNYGVYNIFLDFFSVYPCFIIWPYKIIIQEEMNCYNEAGKTPEFIANAFSILGENDTYNLRKWVEAFWRDKPLVNTIQKEIDNLPTVANSWNNQRKLGPIEYTRDSESFAVMELLCSINRSWFATNGMALDYTKFPSARLMLYSQYFKTHRAQKPITTNDVIDVMISSIIPYVDAVITEASQAEAFKQARKYIPQLKDIAIISIKSLRKN